MSKIMGQRIHDKREEYRMTQEEVAEKLGVTKQTVSKWEAGKVKNIDRDYIGQMAKWWHCDPDWLMHLEDIKKVTATYEAEGREPVTVTVNKEPIMGPSSLRAQLYDAALLVSPENLATAIRLLQSLAPIKNIHISDSNNNDDE